MSRNLGLLLLLFLSTILAHAEDLRQTQTVSQCGHLFEAFVPVAVAVPEGFRAVVATPRLIIGIPKDFIPAVPGQMRVLDRETLQDIGYVQLEHSDNVILNSAISLTRRGEGLGTEAKYAVLKYAFDELHVSEVEDWVEESNEVSMRLHRRLGYVVTHKEGTTNHLLLTKEAFREIERREKVSVDPSSFFFPKPQP